MQRERNAGIILHTLLLFFTYIAAPFLGGKLFFI
ncbi:hypothetical protein CbuK_1656 [Coxiella burnetii CbuK_Q154]|nr:hypothetical protein CbuG_1600 [Coxiella burnetii CbuG_Q212]ACJ20801.1 hypothetical protein CbuK_1656 [Coxiella burnetii CbuK_Q154]EDR36067.1 hypothetical protein COXBURSA334_1652 [Coxiella burnetii Q321]